MLTLLTRLSVYSILSTGMYGGNLEGSDAVTLAPRAVELDLPV